MSGTGSAIVKAELVATSAIDMDEKPSISAPEIIDTKPSICKESDSGDDVDEEEDALAPAPISEKRESHAPQVDVNQLHSEPDFAAVCSFFNKFGVMIGFKPLSFTKLENMLTTFDAQGRVNKELLDLHLMLMRRLRMLSVRTETWENYLKKFLVQNDYMQGELFQLERYGYVHLPVTSKIQILKCLCEAQFDFNPKLKESMLSSCKALDLRLIPVGMDKNGLAYWFQQDIDYNIRVYTEEPDDLSGGTWTLVVRTAEDLDELITRLKSEDLGYVKKEKDAKEKAKEPVPEEGQMIMTTKKGTFLDMCLEDATIKKMRDTLLKLKEARKNKRGDNTDKDKYEEEEEEKVEEVEDTEDLDRRLMPRRSAASRAVSNLKKYVSTPTKRAPRKKKEDDEDDEKSADEKEEGKTGSSAEAESGDESGSGEDEEDEFTDETSGEDKDDEFRPKEARKPKGKRRRRIKKKKTDLDEEEEEDDSDEEEVKVRKMATGQSACGQCQKSGDWDVLLLCDVCDDAWHTYCLKPMLWFVPDGDWFCPKCVHGMLIEKLEEVAKCLEGHLKKKSMEDKKKKAAADRLRREMEYIGVSLNNIVPSQLKQSAIPTSSSSSDEDDGQRRCKRKAARKIAPRIHSRFQMEVSKTIAEGRSRRRTKEVDYNFSEYDNVIQEACEELGEVRPESREGEVVRPTGGAGRGKDMANIIEAEQKRKGSVDSTNEDGERLTGKPASRPTKPKVRRRLNDLDVDNQEESDSEEYEAHASEEEAADEDMPLSGSDYVPTDEERRTRRGGARGSRRTELGPTQSDEDFVVSDSDDSDLGYRGKKKTRKVVEKKKKRARWASDDETEEEAEESDGYSDDSEVERKRRKAKGGKAPPQKKKGRWAAQESDEEENDEDDEVVAEEESEDEDAPKTEAGRPMRRAVAVSRRAKVSGGSSEEDEDEEEVEEPKKKDERPVGALNRNRSKIESDSDEDEFKPEDDEEDEADEDEDESEKEADQAPETKPTIAKEAVKRKAEAPKVKKEPAKESSEDEDESDDEPPIDKKPRIVHESPKKAAAPPPSSEQKPDVVPPSTSAPAKANGSTATPTPVALPVKKEVPDTSSSPAPVPAKAAAPVRAEAKPQPMSEVKPIVVPTSPAPQPMGQHHPVPMSVPQATYAGPMPGHYPPPHQAYYQGGPPPHMGPPPGMPHYQMGPPGRPGPPAGYSPYGPPPTSHWQQGPYGPPPGAMPNNPYAPVHNPYGQPPQQAPRPPGSGTNLNDLQSL